MSATKPPADVAPIVKTPQQPLPRSRRYSAAAAPPQPPLIRNRRSSAAAAHPQPLIRSRSSAAAPPQPLLCSRSSAAALSRPMDPFPAATGLVLAYVVGATLCRPRSTVAAAAASIHRRSPPPWPDTQKRGRQQTPGRQQAPGHNRQQAPGHDRQQAPGHDRQQHAGGQPALCWCHAAYAAAAGNGQAAAGHN